MKQGSIWDSCLQPAAGRKRSRERRLFCYEAVAARMVWKKKTYKQKNGGGRVDSVFLCLESKLLCETQRAPGRDEESCRRNKN